jgi:hypothetical protein
VSRRRAVRAALLAPASRTSASVAGPVDEAFSLMGERIPTRGSQWPLPHPETPSPVKIVMALPASVGGVLPRRRLHPAFGASAARGPRCVAPSPAGDGIEVLP